MRLFFILAIFVLFEPAIAASGEAGTIRVGYFANITHAQAIIGLKQGLFQKALGPEVKIETAVFNAGPSVVEAIFSNRLDLAYVGPNPAINAYVKSKGRAALVIAGAASGGARFVVREELGIKDSKGFEGKKIATPQLGNTQDVAARIWLKSNGLKTSDRGGTVQILPIKNADQLTLFKKKDIDAAWAIEPWATRLIKEGQGKEYLDERDLWSEKKFASALVVVRKDFLKAHPAIVERWLGEHVRVTHWINEKRGESVAMLNAEIAKLSGKPLPADVIQEAMSKLEITYDPLESSVLKMGMSAYELGFIGREKPSLTGLIDTTILNRVLKQQGLKPVAVAGPVE
ncbi:MAG TPA: ABC transporter substrate-binding protein [Bdellovibrionales bacterium]|nr:ABC transporter substrate-binding protein [Bdellovibrionales bacterium]